MRAGVNEPTSLHLAIIPDGNRRWARQRGLRPWEGHREAMTKARALIDWCHQSPDIGVLTLWAFSTENWNRTPAEVTFLMNIFADWLAKERDTFIEKRTRFLHSGRTDRIPATLRDLIAATAEETQSFSDFTVHLALDYGGQDEIVRAVRRVKDTTDVTAATFRQYLDHPELPDIDLVVRTSGEQRASNFFLWQAVYAEWFFLPQYFPELTPDDLQTVVTQYQQRQRRFGQ